MNKTLNEKLEEINSNPNYTSEQKDFHSDIQRSFDRMINIFKEIDKGWIKKVEYLKLNNPEKLKKLMPMLKKQAELRKKIY